MVQSLIENETAVILCVCMIFVTAIAANDILANLYPGQREVGIPYNWKVVEEELSSNISSIWIKGVTDKGARYFVEGDILEVSFSTDFDEYNISKLDFQEATINDSILQEKLECQNDRKCSFRFKVSENAYSYFFNLYLYNKNNKSEIIYPTFLDLYPDIITPEERNERDRNTALLLGSLLSVIFVAVTTGVNQLRQIFHNSH